MTTSSADPPPLTNEKEETTKDDPQLEKDNDKTTTQQVKDNVTTTTKPPNEIKMEGSNDDDDDDNYQPSVSLAVFLYWILPVLCLAVASRFTVDTGPAVKPKMARPMPMKFDPNKAAPTSPPSKKPKKSSPPSTSSYPTTEEPTYAPSYDDHHSPSEIPTILSTKPTGYQEVVTKISKRRLDWGGTSTDPVLEYKHRNLMYNVPSDASTKKNAGSHHTAPKPKPRSKSAEKLDPAKRTHEVPRGGSTDPERLAHLDRIQALRHDFKTDPTNVFKALSLGDALRLFDVKYHDGGTAQEEAIETYQKAIKMTEEKRREMQERGEPTNVSLSATTSANDELMMEYSSRSVDGLLCAMYTALGKVYFMANMFEKAVSSYTSALEVEPYYLDAVSSRGSSQIILGNYEDAGRDFTTVMERDENRRFQDIFTGLARVLQAKENAVPGGWEPMIEVLNDLIPRLEDQWDNFADHPDAQMMLANTLNRFHHVMFLYHDVKTKDTDQAWNHLTTSYEFKKRTLPPWNEGFESQKVASTKQIFYRGFWPAGVGSQSVVPIFIIGFVRSGSTLLERVLDAHPQIVGTGENSVFNGRLDDIRNKIVESSMLGDAKKLEDTIRSLADGVVDEMRERWNMVSSDESRSADQAEPLRYVDKMLTNYYNVGFIHMLFPNALILHVAREPMDTIFSAYKHEFPPGPLDYTSFFPSLNEFYQGYRDLMDHWDRELPGRVTHVKYEDLVNDMPGVARKIIEATGLEWDDSVLDFHRKKHAVNTLSTTQVRKGIYKDSMQAWRRYENHLQPLVNLVGKRTKYNLKTTLPGYTPPQPMDETVGNDASEQQQQDTSQSQENSHSEL